MYLFRPLAFLLRRGFGKFTLISQMFSYPSFQPAQVIRVELSIISNLKKLLSILEAILSRAKMAVLRGKMGANHRRATNSKNAAGIG